MRWLATAAVLGLAFPAWAEPSLKGDEGNGAMLFRVQCAACHGIDARGGGDLAGKLPVPVGDLRDPALLAARSNDDLKNAITKGITRTPPPALMPASPWLTGLELDDIITFLRRDELNVADFFPTAQYFIAKSYTLDQKAQDRIRELSGQSLPPGEASITVVTLYGEGNDKGPLVVPQDPVQLDKLKPKDRKGYLVFAELPQGKAQAMAGLALGRDGDVVAVHSEAGLRASAVDKAYQGFVGQGNKIDPTPFKAPKGKGGPSPAELRAFNLEYARALQGVAQADADEKDRHWADTN